LLRTLRFPRAVSHKIFYDSSRDLPLTHDNGVSAERLEVPDLHIGMSARDDLDVGIRDVRLFNDLTGLKRLGDGNNKVLRVSRSVLHSRESLRREPPEAL
jgi:hypothetical protein